MMWPGKAPQASCRKPRLLDGGRADNDVGDAGVQVALDGVEVADAAAQLHRNLVDAVLLGELLHHLQNRLDGGLVLRLAGEGAVQVDQVQAAGALLEPVQGHVGRVVGENGGEFHIALFEANAVTVFEVDGRNEQHGRCNGLEVQDRVGMRFNDAATAAKNQGFQWTKFLYSCRPTLALFSGWNWVAKMLSRATALQNGAP